MKYIISESKLKPIIKKFLLGRLGSFKESSSYVGKKIGEIHVGSFYTSDRKKMGEIRVKRFDIDEDLYFSMMDMFSMSYIELDEIIIDVMFEMGFEINEVAVVAFM